MKITFVHAPEDYYDQNYGTQFAPLWAFYLAAYVPDNWNVEVLDCRLEKIADCQKADVFAFSGINQDYNSMSKARAYLKNKYPDSTFIIGGPITWSFKQEKKIESLLDFDHVFILDGEEALPKFLTDYEDGAHLKLEKIIESQRYPFNQAKQIRFDLVKGKASRYYGAIVEASRGCPFLCEFCDIRVLPSNNQTNVKSIPLFISEIDAYYKLGITNFQIASDNFIGKSGWAEACVDALLEWKEKNNAQISLFTWLTINIYKNTQLMTKMRRAGFSILFIGIESVNSNSLLETAKVQNLNVLEDAVKIIHSYGFIIAPGLIFGFDSDPDSIFDDTLKFIEETGVVGADPSFLMALAGTPLYERMRKSGRLIERKDERGIERKKVSTNIRYLQNSDFLVNGFMKFVKGFIDPRFQLRRLNSHINLVMKRDNYIAVGKTGYANPWAYLGNQISNFENFKMMIRRLVFLGRPDRFFTAFYALYLVKRRATQYPDLTTSYFYWLYSWTNMALKYQGVVAKDFRLHSVSKDFNRSQLSADAELSDEVRSKMKTDGVKVDIQSQYTKKALDLISK